MILLDEPSPNAERSGAGVMAREPRMLLKTIGLAGQAEVTHVLFNNCYSDYAHRNAQQLEILVS